MTIIINSTLRMEMWIMGLASILDKLSLRLGNLNDSFPSSKPEKDDRNIVNQTPIKIKPSNGDHIFVQRFGSTYHGIYSETGLVYHYYENRISCNTLKHFSEGMPIKIKHSVSSYDSQTIVKRAVIRMHKDKDNITFNNCEHFANWCRSGD